MRLLTNVNITKKQNMYCCTTFKTEYEFFQNFIQIYSKNFETIRIKIRNHFDRCFLKIFALNLDTWHEFEKKTMKQNIRGIYYKNVTIFDSEILYFIYGVEICIKTSKIRYSSKGDFKLFFC